MPWLSGLLQRKPPLPQNLATIRRRLRPLRFKDWRRKIFGASSHHYMSHRASENELVEFESWAGFTLPLDYRNFLLHLGHGRGPYYGLMSLKEIRAEMKLLTEDDKSFSYKTPFPIDRAEVANFMATIKPGVSNQGLPTPWPVGGCIPICNQGCTYLAALVTVGELAGCVLDGWCEAGAVWRPASRPPGIIGRVEDKRPGTVFPPLSHPPTFLEWYVSWIERCVADLQASP